MFSNFSRLTKAFILITMVLFLTIPHRTNSQQQQLKLMYVSPKTENFRMTPNGTVVSSVNQNTPVAVLQEQGNWVQIQIVGWIWKESLTRVKSVDQSRLLRAQHILVKTRAEAQEILQLIKNGEDFTELAKNRSLAPNAEKGGDLGYFNPEDFLPAFSSAIQTCKIGEISAIVETEAGFSIFKRLK